MRKKISVDMFGRDQLPDKPKRKPVAPYVQSERITNYMRDRDREIYKTADAETRAAIEERWK